MKYSFIWSFGIGHCQCVSQTPLNHRCPGGIYVLRKHTSVSGAPGACMCPANTPQSLLPWGHLCVTQHSSITGALGGIYCMCHINTPQSLVPWGHLCVTQTLLSHWFPGPGGIYESGRHSLVTAVLGTSMCHANTP
jgi:hypothetical protein